jgi:hypothetical protein
VTRYEWPFGRPKNDISYTRAQYRLATTPWHRGWDERTNARIERQNIVLEELRAGRSVAKACETARISQGAYRKWRSRYYEFRFASDLARRQDQGNGWRPPRVTPPPPVPYIEHRCPTHGKVEPDDDAEVPTCPVMVRYRFRPILRSYGSGAVGDEMIAAPCGEQLVRDDGSLLS